MKKKVDPVAYARKIVAFLKDLDYDIGETVTRIAKELRWLENSSKSKPNFYSAADALRPPKSGRGRG